MERDQGTNLGDALAAGRPPVGFSNRKERNLPEGLHKIPACPFGGFGYCASWIGVDMPEHRHIGQLTKLLLRRDPASSGRAGALVDWQAWGIGLVLQLTP